MASQGHSKLQFLLIKSLKKLKIEFLIEHGVLNTP